MDSILVPQLSRRKERPSDILSLVKVCKKSKISGGGKEPDTRGMVGIPVVTPSTREESNVMRSDEKTEQENENSREH